MKDKKEKRHHQVFVQLISPEYPCTVLREMVFTDISCEKAIIHAEYQLKNDFFWPHYPAHDDKITSNISKNKFYKEQANGNILVASY